MRGQGAGIVKALIVIAVTIVIGLTVYSSTAESGWESNTAAWCSAGTWNRSASFQATSGTDASCIDPTYTSAWCCADYNDTDSGNVNCCNSSGTATTAGQRIFRSQTSTYSSFGLVVVLLTVVAAAGVMRGLGFI